MNYSNVEETIRHAKLINWIWLKLCLKDSSVKLYKLYEKFGDINSIYSAGPEVLKECNSFLSDDNITAMCDKNTSKAHEIFCLCDAKKIDIITIDDEIYPAPLKDLDYPPCVLFFYGNYLEAFSKPMVTIVGTRYSTSYGEVTTTEISGALALSGCTIVTGCAKGIDSAAAAGALKAGGSVISVLPSGHLTKDFINLVVFNGINFHGGFLSEHLPNATTTKFAYHERNRILAAMSEVTLVTQAPERSGAIITANHALELGRDLYSVPANIDITVSKGSNRLFSDGAFPLLSYRDILEPLISKYGDRLHDRVSENDIIEFSQINEDDKIVSTENDIKKQAAKILTESEYECFNMISTSPVTIDELVNSTGKRLPEILGIMSNLEMKNLVIKLPGNAYKIKL